MMKKVTLYQAADGTLFDSQQAALHHEQCVQLTEWLQSDEDIDWRDPDIRAVAKRALAWRKDANHAE